MRAGSGAGHLSARVRQGSAVGIAAQVGWGSDAGGAACRISMCWPAWADFQRAVISQWLPCFGDDGDRDAGGAGPVDAVPGAAGIRGREGQAQVCAAIDHVLVA